MAITLEELKEKLANQFDEVSLCELLEIDSSDIVIAFSDKIEDRMDDLLTEVSEDNYDL